MTPCQLELVGTALEPIWNHFGSAWIFTNKTYKNAGKFVKHKEKIIFGVILNIMPGFLCYVFIGIKSLTSNLMQYV